MVFTQPVLERLMSWGRDVDWVHEIRDKPLVRAELIRYLLAMAYARLPGP
jgi:hypothetical protein